MATEHHRSMARDEQALLVVAALPALGLALVASLLTRAFLAWGQWPTPGDPDPRGFGLHYNVALSVELLAFAAVPVTVLGLLFAPRSTSRAVGAIAAVVGVAAIIALGQADPGGVTSWLAD